MDHICDECGQCMTIDAVGVSHHLTDQDEYDADADADHVAYMTEGNLAQLHLAQLQTDVKIAVAILEMIVEQLETPPPPH